MTTVFAMAGSIRSGSFNGQLLDAAIAELEALGITVDAVTADDVSSIPLYNGDLQEAEGIPAAVEALHGRVTAADGVVIASPEYNGAFSPLLKNTIDWITRVDMFTFQPKLIGLMGASPGSRGAVHGMGMVAEWFGYMRCTVFEPRFSLPKAFEAFDGAALADAEKASELRSWAENYVTALRAAVEAAAAAAAEEAEAS